MQGELYNRHVKFMGDHGIFHEELVALRSWRPRVPQHIYEAQSVGQELKLTGTEKDIAVRCWQLHHIGVHTAYARIVQAITVSRRR